jgi:hypothetical protein
MKLAAERILEAGATVHLAPSLNNSVLPAFYGRSTSVPLNQ